MEPVPSHHTDLKLWLLSCVQWNSQSTTSGNRSGTEYFHISSQDCRLYYADFVHDVTQEKEPRLPNLLKLLVWAQNQLDTRCTYPRINDLSAPTLTDPMQT